MADRYRLPDVGSRGEFFEHEMRDIGTRDPGEESPRASALADAIGTRSGAVGQGGWLDDRPVDRGRPQDLLLALLVGKDVSKEEGYQEPVVERTQSAPCLADPQRRLPEQAPHGMGLHRPNDFLRRVRQEGVGAQRPNTKRRQDGLVTSDGSTDRIDAPDVTLEDLQQGMLNRQLDRVAHERRHRMVALECLLNELPPGPARRTEYEDT